MYLQGKYLQGKFVQDDKKAVYWFTQAAEQGHAEAQKNLISFKF
tara:strand:- start:708 stop:839 length:132 start_codon:yes stop_codon:yes gene_type:complete